MRNASHTATAHGVAAADCTLLLWAVGQPIFTDDVWWHLALGRWFWKEGPWLDADPLLFAAAGPPSPAAWLSDLALFGAATAWDFTGLRVLHTALVAAILALVWSLARRASRSAPIASLATLAFVVLAAYRVFQLRPELVSILATLALYRLLIEHGQPPSPRRIALAGAIAALWANAHAAFVLGPLLLAAATAGVAVSALRGAAAERDRARARAIRLGFALALVSLATLANPLGVSAYLAYFAAGSETPALALVSDEWAPFPRFGLPIPTLPPTPIAWVLVWGLVIGVGFTVVRALRTGRRVDAALVGVTLASLALLFSAVRFLWLGIFPVLLLASAPRARSFARTHGAAAAVLLVALFVRFGDWPLITRALPTTWPAYAKPYPAAKYFGHSIWFLRDAQLRGNLYNDYFQGGFAGFWLAPGVRTIVNGTLNVPSDTLVALQAIAERRGQRAGESFPALLDRLGIDLFLGIRPPEVGHPVRPWAATTAHLERTPGWIPIFRGLTSAVYLRQNERNRENLERVAAYFVEQRVPFDPDSGFDVETVIRDAPEWAIEHGVIPRNFLKLEQWVQARPRSGASDRLAALCAALGLYERAVALDGAALRVEPGALRARRRLVWSLLRLRHFEEAASAAAPLAERPTEDGLSRAIAETARTAASLDPAGADAAIARLPFLSRAEVTWLLAGNLEPEPRRFR